MYRRSDQRPNETATEQKSNERLRLGSVSWYQSCCFELEWRILMERNPADQTWLYRINSPRGVVKQLHSIFLFSSEWSHHNCRGWVFVNKTNVKKCPLSFTFSGCLTVRPADIHIINSHGLKQFRNIVKWQTSSWISTLFIHQSSSDKQTVSYQWWQKYCM